MSIDRLREAVVALADAVDDKRLVRPFDDEEERRNWFYWPDARNGVPFSDMTSDQSQLVYGVLAAILNVHALAKVTTIVGLEEVLREVELGGLRRRR